MKNLSVFKGCSPAGGIKWVIIWLLIAMVSGWAGQGDQDRPHKPDSRGEKTKSKTLLYQDSESHLGSIMQSPARKNPRAPWVEAYRQAREQNDVEKMKQIEQKYILPLRGGDLQNASFSTKSSGTVGFPGEPLLDGGSGFPPIESATFGTDIHVRSVNTTFTELNPAMATASDGTIYIVWENVNSGQTDYLQIYYSMDNGETWTAYGWIGNATYPLSQPSLAIGEGAQDLLVIAWVVDDGAVPHVEVGYTPLYPTGFNVTVVTPPYLNFWTAYSKPNVWTDSYDWGIWYAYLTAEAEFGAPNYNVVFWRSTDYGATWGTQHDVPLGNLDPYAWRDPDGTYGTIANNLFIATFNETDSTLYTIISPDFGASWSDTVSIFKLTAIPSKPVEPDIEAATNLDNVMLCCTKSFNGNDNIGQIYSTDGGYTWSNLFSLEGYTSVNEFAAELTANEGGNSWHVGYTTQNWYVYHSARPQDLSQFWQPTPDVVNDVDFASAVYRKKGITSNWSTDAVGIAWADYRDNVGADYDIYYDFDRQFEAPQNLYAYNDYQGAVPLAWDPPAGFTPLKNTNEPAEKLSVAAHKSSGQSTSSADNSQAIGNHNEDGNDLDDPALLPPPTLVSYNIFRSTTAGGPYTQIASNVNRQYYRDESVVNGTTYYYVVSAVYSNGESGYSNEASAAPATGGYFIPAGWASTIPALDGVILPGEWNNATVVDITEPSSPTPSTLYVMNDNGYLYLAVDDPGNTALEDNDQIGFYFDENRDREWPPASPSGEGNFWVGWLSNATQVEYRGLFGWWPANFYADPLITPAPGVNAGISLNSGHVQYETRIDLANSEFNAAPGDTIGCLFFSLNQSPYVFSGWWPQELISSNWGDDWRLPAAYGDLELATQACSGTAIGEVLCPGNAPQNSTVTVNIQVDMTGINPPDHLLGSFSGTLHYNPALASFNSHSGILSGFTGVVNVDNTTGVISFNGANPTGAGGVVPLLNVDFDAIGPIGSTVIMDLQFSAMASALTFTDLMPCLQVNDCNFDIVTPCKLGDINGDNQCNSTDALIILSYDVGLPIPQPFLDKILLGCGDANSDGFTNSTDALIILSYDVGISVPFPVCQ